MFYDHIHYMKGIANANTLQSPSASKHKPLTMKGLPNARDSGNTLGNGGRYASASSERAIRSPRDHARTHYRLMPGDAIGIAENRLSERQNGLDGRQNGCHSRQVGYYRWFTRSVIAINVSPCQDKTYDDKLN